MRRKTAKKQPSTNVDFLTTLMEHAKGGRLMQAFILEAVSVYAQLVQADPEQWTPGFVGQEAWSGLAKECIDAIYSRFIREQ